MVNVIDIEEAGKLIIPEPTKEKDMLDLMFERQHGLANKYIPIEKNNGLLQTESFPVNLDDRKGQARLKDFAWRTMEELFEATDSLIQHPDNQEHFLEEMIDSLHFFIELNLLCGIDSHYLGTYFEIDEDMDKLEYLEGLSNNIESFSKEEIKDIPVSIMIYSTIGQPIGNAMNKLKNKPWKQTHMITDREAFEDALIPAWLGYFRVLGHKYGLSAKDIFNTYFKKSEVNKFRIRSGY